MPSTASFLSTAAGMLHVPFEQFLLQSLLIQFFWSLVWGGLAYLFGITFAQIFLQYFGLIALAGFVIFLLRRWRKKRSRQKKI
jgi:membrane protein DedA with SNARE-associated domain